MLFGDPLITEGVACLGLDIVLTKEELMEQNIEHTQQEIRAECDALRDLLLEKNRKYGDSALSPARVFSRASPIEQILVRIDDKLSRIRTSGTEGPDEDTVQDLLGYLVLLRVARRRQAGAGAKP